MTLALPPQLVPLVEQVRANPRLQAGLGLVLLLVAGWLVLVLGDQRAAGVEALVDARQRYFQVRQLSGQDVWESRASEAVRLADALEAEIPPSASAGLAQATFQDWLGSIVQADGTQVRIEMQAPVRMEPPTEDIVRITAVVSGSLDPRRAWAIIHRLEASTALVTLPTLTVRSDGANQTFSLTVQGFYRVPPATTGAAG